MKPFYESPSGDVVLWCGDCREVLAALPAGSVQACVTDPPYGLEFMGKEWDKLGAVVQEVNDTANRDGNWTTKPFGGGGQRVRYGKSAASMQAWHLAWATEALRVLLPGAHLLAFGGTRTYHRLACAIEDAGFEIRDCIRSLNGDCYPAWVFGSGFPKSLDVSKAIDRAAGAAREVVGQKRWAMKNKSRRKVATYGTPNQTVTLTSPATDAAKQWDGWGSALKPAWEPICLARKPLDGTVAANVLKHGVGGLNIDACRVPTNDSLNGGAYSKDRLPSKSEWVKHGGTIHDSTGQEFVQPLGRWPANVIHDGTAEILAEFAQYGERKSGGVVNGTEPSATGQNGIYGHFDRVANEAFSDRGTAARFFYAAKASRRERGEWIDEVERVELRSDITPEQLAFVRAELGKHGVVL